VREDQIETVLVHRADKLDRLERENARLRKSLSILVAYADKTWEYWDADEDHKVGKRLRAMAGGLPGYDADVDEAHRLYGVTL